MLEEYLSKTMTVGSHSSSKETFNSVSQCIVTFGQTPDVSVIKEKNSESGHQLPRVKSGCRMILVVPRGTGRGPRRGVKN